jgi:hypothetical protein
MLRAPYCAPPSLNATMATAGLVATARAFAAETLKFSDSLFRARNVIRIVPNRGESCAILLYPDLERVDYTRELVRDGFVRTRLILSHPEQFI